MNIIAKGHCGFASSWTFYENGLLVISGNGLMQDYNIVKRPEYHKYRHCVKRIVIENGIKHIGSYAFADFSSVSGDLIIPDSVTSIGIAAFQSNMSPGYLELGENVETIGAFAFAFCKNLIGNLILPDSVKNIGGHSFFRTGFNKKLQIGSGIEILTDFAFSESMFTEDLIIPENVKVIKLGCFLSCRSLNHSLILPETIERVDAYAFSECPNLSGKIKIPKSGNINEFAFDNSPHIEIVNNNPPKQLSA